MILTPLLNLLAPLVKGFVRRRLSKGLEEAPRLQERYGLPTVAMPAQGTQVVWFHGASVGEVMSLIPIIQGWKKKHPHHFILLTTTTVTGGQLVQQRLGHICTHQYTTFDIPKWGQRFLDFWNPCLAVFAESEIWPNQMHALKRRGIPLVLLNGRLSPRSLERWKKIPKLAKNIFSTITLCLAQDETTAQNFSDLGVETVKTITNLKFLAEPLPVDEDVFSFFSSICARRPVWVVASTHPGEEEMAIHCHEKIKAVIPDLLTFIIPRHPKRVDEVSHILDKKGIMYQRRKAFDVTKKVDVCLVDSLGEMGVFYKLAHVVFLGGSLVPIGGHNPIEPALFAKPIVWGPHIHKTVAIGQTFANALCQIKTPEELAHMTQKLLQDRNLADTYGKACLAVVQAQAQQLDMILDILSEIQAPHLANSVVSSA